MRYGLIRLDIEDFLTPESDDGLEAMLDLLDHHQLPASFGVVGEKAEALKQRGRGLLLERLAAQPALGFHSLSHSRHPTLAEELATFENFSASVERFVSREGQGVAQLSDLIKAPCYFTQPGGNWVPQAADGLPQLGMNIYFSESWNSYLIEWPEPLWFESVLHFSLPVPTPGSFLLGLPTNLDDAVARIRAVDEVIPDGGAFTIMTHPTELVSTKFWDVVNFGSGRTQSVLGPAPLRPADNYRAAVEALDRYLGVAKTVAGVEWVNVVEFVNRVNPKAPCRITREQLRKTLATSGLGPARIGEGSVSAASLVWALASFVVSPEVSAIEVPVLTAPLSWQESPASDAGFEPSGLIPAAKAVLDQAERERRLAGDAIGMAIETFARAATIELFGPELAGVPLTFLGFVKAPAQLHWDWPIFPPQFQPHRLWEETRRLAWTIAPVCYRA